MKLLGLDISTTSAKALLIDQDGQVIESASNPIALSSPHPLWSEQNPDEWWTEMRNSIRSVLKMSMLSAKEITAIGLTGQMHGLVMLDSFDQVVRPAILWNDQRTAHQCDQIRERIGKESLIQITGNDALTGFTAPKILWVQQNEPAHWDQCRQILLPKDFIRFKLTGEFGLDKAGASGTGLFDLAKRSWSDHILSALDISKDLLPATYEGPEVTGVVSKSAAEETGLAAGIPVVGGGGDQAAQAVGVGAVEPGIVALTLGTSGVVFATTEGPIIEPGGRLHGFCHAAPDRWHLMGVMLSAAGSLDWYRSRLAPDVSFDELLREAADVGDGAEGLLFLPYLSGERTPHPDPLARGAWVGLTLRHKRAHLTRSILEGVAFGIKDNFALINQAGLGPVEQVRVSGGGTKSQIWRQIIANILDIDLVSVNTSEGAAYGAALLAAVGAGFFESTADACQACVRITGRTSPIPSSIKQYEPYYQQYRSLYPALSQEFRALAAIDS